MWFLVRGWRKFRGNGDSKGRTQDWETVLAEEKSS